MSNHNQQRIKTINNQSAGRTVGQVNAFGNNSLLRPNILKKKNKEKE